MTPRRRHLWIAAANALVALMVVAAFVADPMRGGIPMAVVMSYAFLANALSCWINLRAARRLRR